MLYPNYYNPYQGYQMQNQNYFNQMQQFPQIQQNNVQTNNNSLGGKIVDGIEVVKVTDVPMDGNFYYFPKADGTEIYTKRWLMNGTTEILTFVKNDIVDTEQNSNDGKVIFENMESNIIGRLNEIDNKIERILTPNRNQNKKEG